MYAYVASTLILFFFLEKNVLSFFYITFSLIFSITRDKNYYASYNTFSNEIHAL